MASETYNPRTIYDYLSSFQDGVNSGVNPQLLQKSQMAFGLNCSIRGGFVHNRPPIQKKTLDFGGDTVLQDRVEKGFFQGAGYYRPDFGPESLIASISGRIFKFTESGSSWTVTDISIAGDLNSATAYQVWMWQAEKWLIIQDGTGALPIFFDGTSCRRSYGPSKLLGTTAAGITLTNPRVIGEIITAVLTTNYTGNYDIPVIFNGEFYQLKSQSSGGYLEVLTNFNDVPGAVIPSGSKIIANPNIVGVIESVTEWGDGPFKNVYLHILTNSLPAFRDNIFIAGSSVGVGYFTIWDVQPSGIIRINSPSSVSFAVGSAITYASSKGPSFEIGTTILNFTVPNVLANLSVKLNLPYTATSSALVTINDKIYLILPHSPSAQISTVYLENLTDLSDAGTTIGAGATIYSVPELPAGRCGAYGMGRNWMSLIDGISYIGGDVVGGGAGTVASNYRDSVLKTTENDFMTSGGTFRLPGAGDIITAMSFPATVDTSLGQGALQIFTAFSSFSNNSPPDRTTWKSLTYPIQTQSLKGQGALSQDATININSDTFFRSGIGVGSLVLARRQYTDWGNKPISHEMGRILDQDEKSLLSYGSAIDFDNRHLMTCAPNVSAQGVFHVGITALNFDSLSSMRGSLPPAWEGVWTGVNVLKCYTGRINGAARSLAFTFNIAQGKIELYEFLSERTDSYQDNDETPITWVFETPVAFNKDVKPLTELCQLRDGEVYLSKINGTVNVQVFYKPDYYPCWTLWKEFAVCSDLTGENANPAYRMRIGLGEPSVEPVEMGNNRPLRTGYFFQCRVVITGSCTWNGIRASAITIPVPEFARVEDAVAGCQAINCDIPDDLRVYSLQGLPALPLPAITPEPCAYKNDAVYSEILCPSGSLIIGNLPQWIEVDDAQRLKGAAGIFCGATLAAANSRAQEALNNYVDLHRGEVSCGEST
jgi:hypothetical protein